MPRNKGAFRANEISSVIPATVTSSDVASSSGRILIVDDDRDFADSLQSLLTLEGFEAAVAYDADHALDTIQGFDAQFAIIDYRLGSTVGLDLVAPLKQLRPRLMCLLATAYADMDTAVQALRRGVYDYLRKPLHTEELLSVIERCKDRYLLEEGKLIAERALAEEHAILETALNTIPDGVLVLDNQLKLVAWNEQVFDVLEVNSDAILTAIDPVDELLSTVAERGDYGPGETSALVARLKKLLCDQEPRTYEQRLIMGKWIKCRTAPMPNSGYIAVYRDINESKSLNERLEHLASVDALTNALNRRKFIETADAEFQRSRRYGRTLSFLVMDIDHFKSVNDSYGHATGDETLRSVARACRSVLRDADILGRIGGEEFAVVLPETDARAAHLAAERLRRAVAATTLATTEGNLSVTVSVGIAQAAPSHESAEAVIADADSALYQAKRTGRNKSMHASTARQSTAFAPS